MIKYQGDKTDATALVAYAQSLEDRLDFAEFEWNRATAGMQERDAVIARLQDAKRAALKLADERAIEANGLRQCEADLRYEAGMYQSLYELSESKLAKAKLALENIAAWRKVNMVGEFEPGLRDIIRSMTDCAADALDSLSGENGK